MKVYIAGKITGDPMYHEKFQKAKETLERDGCTVINPAILPEGMKPADYMQICIAMIYSADVVVFLPDWSNSRGAVLEFDLCDYIGKPIKHLADFHGERTEEIPHATVEIIRDGRKVLTVQLNPIRDSDVQYARKMASRNAKKQLDMSAFKDWIIFLATIKEDRKIWVHPGRIDNMLTAGEKYVLVDKICEISGLNEAADS